MLTPSQRAHALPHIVTVGRYRVGRVMRREAQRWEGRARFTHIAASFDEAVAQVRALQARLPIDALVGAGASGARLREALDLPLALVEVRGLDLLHSLHQARQLAATSQASSQVSSGGSAAALIGLVSFEEPAPEMARLDALLGMGLAQFAYHGPEDAAACVQQLQAAGVGAVVAPGLIADLAEQAGIPSVLLYSDAAVRQAFTDAMLLARQRSAERDRHARLETVLDQLQDGVVAVDEQGCIRALNPRMAQLLGASREALYGRLLDQVAPSLNVARALSVDAGDDAGEEVVQLAMRTLVVRRGPMVENALLTGALLVCRDPAQIQRADRSLRADRNQRGAGVRWRIEDYRGASALAQRVRAMARHYAAVDATVLIQGESGTGKEVVAQGIHRASRRAAQPFLAVNCAALSESLLESELFGYEEGAFTGARRGGRVGLIESAHTGTLFLDEIGDMPLALQSRLLRVLQEREVLRVGASTPVPVDVRVIAATHADLAAQVQCGAFRRDLFYRLAVLRLELPSLLQRGPADVREMAQAMLERRGAAGALDVERDVQAAGSSQNDPLQLQQVLQMLLDQAAGYGWPGNARELDNWVERLLACQYYLLVPSAGAEAEGAAEVAVHSQLHARLLELFPECAGNEGLPPAALLARQATLKQTRKQAERERLREVLDSVAGDQGRACELLGISRATLWRRLRET